MKSWDWSYEVRLEEGWGVILKQNNNWILKATGGMALGRERFREEEPGVDPQGDTAGGEARINVDGLAAVSLDFFASRARSATSRPR